MAQNPGDVDEVKGAFDEYKKLVPTLENIINNVSSLFDQINAVNKAFGEGRLRATEFSTAISDSVAGVNYPNNSPGVYITPIIVDEHKGNTAGLLIKMNSFNKINENVTIGDLPLHKWVNIIIRVTKQNQMDVYINGTLVKRHMLAGVPKQNYGDVYASMNGGFSGNTADLRYFEKALGTSQIQNIINKGPNTNLISGVSMGKNDTNKYLSTRWFLKTAQDA